MLEAHFTICHCGSLRSEQYLQFSGASGILSQHLVRMSRLSARMFGACMNVYDVIYPVRHLKMQNIWQRFVTWTDLNVLNLPILVPKTIWKHEFLIRISKVRPVRPNVYNYHQVWSSMDRCFCQHLPALVVPGQRTSTSLRSVSGGLGGQRTEVNRPQSATMQYRWFFSLSMRGSWSVSTNIVSMKMTETWGLLEFVGAFVS